MKKLILLFLLLCGLALPAWAQDQLPDSWAAGTQNGTQWATGIPNGHYAKFTFVADGTLKQTSWHIGATQ